MKLANFILDIAFLIGIAGLLFSFWLLYTYTEKDHLVAGICGVISNAVVLGLTRFVRD